MTSLTIETLPAPVVLLGQAKTALRIRHTRDDVFLQGALDTAISYLDGPKGILGKLLGPQAWIWTFGSFGTPLVLPIGPVTSVTSITYLDAAGVAQVLPSNTCYLVRSDDFDTISLVAGAAWPVTSVREDAITVKFVGGLAPIPPRLTSAILTVVAHLNEHRGMVDPLAGFESGLSFSALISDFRRYL